MSIKLDMFTKGMAIEFIEKSFGKSILSNGGLNASVTCPECARKTDGLEKRKLVIRTDNFLVHCWVCNYRSRDLVDLLTRYHPVFLEEYKDKFNPQQSFAKCDTSLEDVLYGKKTEIKSQTHLNLPEGFCLIATNRGKGLPWVEEAWNYLKTRNVSESDLWLWKFGVTNHQPSSRNEKNYRHRIIVPSFDSEGNLNFFSARSYWNKLNPKYTNPDLHKDEIVFNELLIDWSQELLVVEGVFDLVKTTSNATCLLGSTLGPNSRLFHRIVENETPIVLGLDNDAESKSIKIAEMLMEYGINVRKLEIPEQFNDIGQMSKMAVEEQRKKAKSLSKETMWLSKLL